MAMSQPQTCSNCGQPTASYLGVCTRKPCERAYTAARKVANPGQHREYMRAFYARNPEAKRQETAQKRDWFRSLKVGKSCTDCGLECTETNYFVFDWDHRPDEVKEFQVSSGRYRGKVKVLAEVAKCDLRCRNCHATVTHQRGQYGPRGRAVA